MRRCSVGPMKPPETGKRPVSFVRRREPQTSLWATWETAAAGIPSRRATQRARVESPRWCGWSGDGRRGCGNKWCGAIRSATARPDRLIRFVRDAEQRTVRGIQFPLGEPPDCCYGRGGASMMERAVPISNWLIGNDLTVAVHVVLAAGIRGERLEVWPLGPRNRVDSRAVTHCTHLC